MINIILTNRLLGYRGILVLSNTCTLSSLSLWLQAIKASLPTQANIARPTRRRRGDPDVLLGALTGQ